MNFGEILKQLRKNKGYSMDELIELYNKKFAGKMNKSTLSRYENGLQDPLYTVVVNLANLFNVTVDFLSGVSEFPTPQTTLPRQTGEYLFLTPTQRQILSNCQQLNETGQKKVLDFSDDLVSTEKYKPIGREPGYRIAAYGADETEEDFQAPIEEITT